MSIYQKLLKIQTNLKAPKSQYNKFGNYKYRNCEDILEAVKPLLVENNVVLKITDEVVFIGERYYIKAIAKLIDVETAEIIENIAYAREEETKKGMDGSQITGASSSYARKYALNGLFAIDDTKDSDTTNQGEQQAKTQPKPQIKNICPKCGKEMTENVILRSGKTVTPQKFIAQYGVCDKCKIQEVNNNGQNEPK